MMETRADPAPRTSAKRDRLVATAADLFYRQGIHATGIDQIIAEAGVARMTLYKHFRTKEELVIAALQLRGEAFDAWFCAEVRRRAETPRARLLAVFDVLDDWFRNRAGKPPPFQGCTFINASAEYGDPAAPVRRVAAEHKAALRGFLAELARQAGAADPETLARNLALLQEGAIVTAQVGGDLDAARRAKALAAPLIEAACPD